MIPAHEVFLAQRVRKGSIAAVQSIIQEQGHFI